MTVSKKNHACIKCSPKINAALCEKLLKKKYGLSNEENLLYLLGYKLVEHEEIKEINEQYMLFSTSLGAFCHLKSALMI